MDHQINAPPQYRSGQNEALDWSYSDIARYISRYDERWWNCIRVRAVDIDAVCLTMCSGTPAASQGCADGALAASERIDQNIARFGKHRTQKSLQILLGITEMPKNDAPGK